MSFDLMVLSASVLQKAAVLEIEKCNDVTVDYGLMLTKEEAVELVETRTEALINNGRIEFGGGIIQKIILEFCDSPYLYQNNYTEMLHELIEIFYYYKNETLDLVSDDELISFMKKCFDGKCQGSLELLRNRELEQMAHNVRFWHDPEYKEDEEEELEEEEEEDE